MSNLIKELEKKYIAEHKTLNGFRAQYGLALDLITEAREELLRECLTDVIEIDTNDGKTSGLIDCKRMHNKIKEVLGEKQ